MKSFYRLLLVVPAAGLAMILAAAYEQMVPLRIGVDDHSYHQAVGGDQERIGQTIQLPYPGLYQIDLHVTNFGQPVDRPILLTLRSQGASGAVLAQETLQTREWPESQWVSFVFPPIDQQNLSVYLEIHALDGPMPGPIGFTASSRNPYIGGYLTVNGQPTESDLHFAAFFQPSPPQLAGIVLERMAAKKPGVWGDPRFYVALFLAYTLSVFALLWRVLEVAFAPVGDRAVETSRAEPDEQPPASSTAEPAVPAGHQ